MNKTKITLLSIGGVALVGTLVLGFLIYNTWSAKEEKDDDISYLRDDASRLTSLKVYPAQASVKATDANRQAYADWCDLATGLASAGDMKFEPTTPASFKSFINEEAKRFSDMPGAIAGRFVKAGFGFGFDEYILKGALPSAADLPRLQREWHDVSVFLNLLSDAKVSSVAELTLAKEEAVEEAPANGRKRNVRNKNVVEFKPDVTRFNIVFTASPSSFVSVMNAIAANPRFIVAESFSFVRGSDEIAAKLGEKNAKKSDSGRRSRRRPSAEETASVAESEEMVGSITDPATAPDLKVSMTVAVYDFRTKSAPQEEKEVSK